MNHATGYALASLFLVLLAMDLGLFGRRGRAQKPADAVAWSIAWLVIGASFTFFVHSLYEYNWQGNALATTQGLAGREAALQFLGAFGAQKTLCAGAMIMTALLFSHFRLSLAAQRRTLFWVVFGSLSLKICVASLGARVVRNQDWALYLLGGVVIFYAAALIASRHDNFHPRRNPLVRLAGRFFPRQENHPKSRFFRRERGGWRMTHAFLALLMAQSVAVGFAVSSMPAAAVFTREPFLVVTSAACACLGLRSLYFVVAAFLDRMRFFKISLGVSVGLLGIQFLAIPYLKLSRTTTVAWLLVVLGTGACLSWRHRDASPLLSPLAEDLEEIGEISVKQTRRVVTVVMGGSMVLLGIVFLLTPLPGLLTIFAGLGVLSAEFIWARRWLAALRERAQRLRRAWFKGPENSA